MENETLKKNKKQLLQQLERPKNALMRYSIKF